MNESVFQYQCAACGNTWHWTYLFVVKCPSCKTYLSFHEATVNASEVPVDLVLHEAFQPFQAPAVAAPVAGKLALNGKGNGGYSHTLWPLSEDENSLPAA